MIFDEQREVRRQDVPELPRLSIPKDDPESFEALPDQRLLQLSDRREVPVDSRHTDMVR
ncbi:hypothetical protein [Curtobacterium aetherium]|uniref:Uncharacterized protein n=1 Tax=Curtobacterium aetherium TaxID=2841594 RepID=A0ACD1E1H5_9MICO|nr:hypothetical protein [Curtobacterium sp. L6-1]QWS32603.1 hypothetical protein KM842_09900 [Curtobacterium sp. L6-1]